MFPRFVNPARTPAIHSTQIKASRTTTNPCLLSHCHLLDLNLRHGGSRAPQIRLLRLGVLGVIIADRALDRVFRQHAAMQLNGWETQLLRDLGVPDLARLLERHAAHQLSQVGRRCDCRAAAEGLKFYVRDGVIIRVDFDLQFHHVAAGRRADEAYESG